METIRNPFGELAGTANGARAIEKLAEALGVQAPAGLEAFAASEPGASDICINLRRQLEQGALDAADKFVVAIAVAAAESCPEAVAFLSEAGRRAGLDAQQCLDAVAAAAVCQTYNGYYSFRDMATGTDFDGFRAPLNANSLVKSTLTPARVELVCVVVSARNHCVPCVNAHIKKARAVGLTDEQIDEAVRAGAAVRGFALAVNALRGMAAPAVPAG